MVPAWDISLAEKDLAGSGVATLQKNKMKENCNNRRRKVQQ